MCSPCRKFRNFLLFSRSQRIMTNLYNGGLQEFLLTSINNYLTDLTKRMQCKDILYHGILN